MISLYGLTYYALEYAQESIDSIIATADEALEINVINSKSARSDEIDAWGKSQVDIGRIKRLISASTNCKGAGPVWAYKSFPPESDFIIITDLDIIAKPGWLQDVKKNITKKKMVGFTLDETNYVEPNYGFVQNGFGSWLMSIQTQTYDQYVSKYDHHWDALVLQEADWNYYKSPIKLVHRGWDTHKDYPSYWQEKLSPVDWMTSATASYKVYEKCL